VPYRIKTQAKKTILEPEVLIDRYEQFGDWVTEHWKPVVATVGILALAGAIWGLTAWMGYRAEQQAARLYAEAWKTYQTASASGQQQKTVPAEAKAGYEQAIAGFQKVRDQYPRTTHATFALYQLGNAHTALEQYDQAIAAYLAWLKDYDHAELAPWVTQRLAYTYWQKGLPQDALAQFDRVLKMPDAPNRDQSYFETGRILEQQGQKDKALETYNSLAKDFPSSPWSSEAIARIVALGGTPPARETAQPQNPPGAPQVEAPTPAP
jgi:tetratricopeptide (TPR) repeat protein